MPDINFYHDLKMRSRRHPTLHRPLRKIRRLLAEKIPAAFTGLLRALAPANSFRFGPPKSSFSIYQSLSQKNPPANRILLTGQGAPKTTADSLMVVSNLKQHICQPWPVFWSRHKSARLVSPSLALLDGRKRVALECVYGDIGWKDDPAWNYLILPKPVPLAGNWTSLVSRWCPNGGVPTFTHWILDALPRLAMLPEFPPDTKILVPSKLAAYQKETLQLLGLLDRVRHAPEPHLIVENYFFASPTAMIDCYNPFGVNFLREKFLPLADKNYSGPKKFLIHRANKSRGIVNEAETYEFFRKRGWAIIDTEKLTFAQEIKLFNDAKAVGGVFGSGFTNAIWCRPGCKLIPFVADCWLDGYVEWIAQVVGAEFHHRIFPSDHAMRARVNLKTVEEMLATTGLAK
jgi:glycosyl transferase family 61